MKLNTIIASAAMFFNLGATSIADEIKVGNLTIEHPAIRATVPNAKVAGEYMVVRNTGKMPDSLIGGSAIFSGKVQIHKMGVTNGIMKMRKLPDGLEIPAGGLVHLKPGSFHIMFMKLKEQMKAGEKRKVVIEFKNAGKAEIEFSVETIAATLKHGQMDHSNMNHGEMNKESN